MKISNIILIGLILILFAIGVFAGSTSFLDSVIVNNTVYSNQVVVNSTGGINGSINWSMLMNYPAACPAGAVTTLADSPTCSDSWVELAGDTMTGGLNITTINATGQVNASEIILSSCDTTDDTLIDSACIEDSYLSNAGDTSASGTYQFAGNVKMGSTTATSHDLEVINSVAFTRYVGAGAAAPIAYFQRSQGSEGSPSNVAANDWIGKFIFRGYVGGWSDYAMFGARVENTNKNATFFVADGDSNLIWNVHSFTQHMTVGAGAKQANITMTSPDASEWCCGVSDAGAFSCMAGACS